MRELRVETAPPDFGPPLFDVRFDNEIEVVAKGPLAFELRFPPDGDAIRLPRELVIGNDQLIAAGTCDQHSGFGLGFAPTYQIAPRLFAGAADGQSSLDISLSGPAIVRTRIDWTLPFTCGSTWTAATSAAPRPARRPSRCSRPAASSATTRSRRPTP